MPAIFWILTVLWAVGFLGYIWELTNDRVGRYTRWSELTLRQLLFWHCAMLGGLGMLVTLLFSLYHKV